jgi:hypothetical protein
LQLRVYQTRYPIYQRPGHFVRAFAFVGVFMVTMWPSRAD